MGQNFSHFTDGETNHQEGPNSWPNEARGMFGTTLDPLTNQSQLLLREANSSFSYCIYNTTL